MNRQAVLSRIKEAAVIPVVRTPDAGTAMAAVEALHEGGMNCIEVTMTVGSAVKVLEKR